MQAYEARTRRLPETSSLPDAELIIVGGGLAAALIAKRLTSRHRTQVLIVEASAQPFGDHTWSFHASDVGTEDHDWLEPLIAHRWKAQTVRFPAYERDLNSGYATLSSASVRQAIGRVSQIRIEPGARAVSVEPHGVVLADGRRLSAPCVIDARGYRASPSLVLGYQKFVGLEIETTSAHGLAHPVIMDATVDQCGGYRFVYLLPFSPTRVLVEDTRYADGSALDDEELEQSVLDYVGRQGWTVATVVRRERGVLPIPLAYDAERFWSEAPGDVPQAGMRAALFHPVTGYSLPDSVRVAKLVADAWPIGSADLARIIRDYAIKRHRAQRYYRFLNRMLFLAAEPTRRRLVLQRFYRLPRPLIERFYAGTTTGLDMARIMTGKPPVPVHRALGCLREAPLLSVEKT